MCLHPIQLVKDHVSYVDHGTIGLGTLLNHKCQYKYVVVATFSPVKL